MMNFLMSPVQRGHGDFKSQCPCASGCPPALVVCCTGLDFSVLDSTVIFSHLLEDKPSQNMIHYSDLLS